MTCADAKDVVTRTKALMLAFGWQGGTIHQVAKVTGCAAHDLIYAKANEHDPAYWRGRLARCTIYNADELQEQQKGDLQFWLGVAERSQSQAIAHKIRKEKMSMTMRQRKQRITYYDSIARIWPKFRGT